MLRRRAAALGVCSLLSSVAVGAQEAATLSGRIIHKTSQAAIQGAAVVLNPRAFTGGGPCFAEVYLDGVIVYAFGTSAPLFDVNTIAPQHVAAIEFYNGPAQIPAQYNKTGGACGILLIWLK